MKKKKEKNYEMKLINVLIDFYIFRVLIFLQKKLK